jgi:hypothetical protein
LLILSAPPRFNLTLDFLGDLGGLAVPDPVMGDE